MTLDHWASIATIVEAVFVIISVYFILYELRQSNKLNRAANAQTLVELSSPFNLQLIQDREMADLWQRGAQQFDDMEKIDQGRYVDLLTWWLIFHENIYYQQKQGLIDESIYEGWRHDLRIFVRRHDLARHWWRMKKVYHDEFTTEVSELIESQSSARVV